MNTLTLNAVKEAKKSLEYYAQESSELSRVIYVDGDEDNSAQQAHDDIVERAARTMSDIYNYRLSNDSDVLVLGDECENIMQYIINQRYEGDRK